MSILSSYRPVNGHPSRCARQLMVLLVFGLVPVFAFSATVLTLPVAERKALESDPQVAALLARARSANQGAIAAGQHQDPKLSMGLFNLPLDNFDLNEQPTTQMRFGLHQQLSRGDTLSLREQQKNLQGDALSARAENRARISLRDLRLAWLDVYYPANAGRIIDENRKLFQQLLEITEDQYAAGRAYQQDVFRAQLELGLLDDRRAAMQRKERTARGELSYWIGNIADQQLPENLPQLQKSADPALIREQLLRHPAIVEQTAILEVSEKSILIARERYRPQWTLGAEYRKRFGDDPAGGDRSDMLAVVASVDLPIFRKNRQDRELLAATEQHTAVDLDRTEQLLKLKSSLAREIGQLEGLASQLDLFLNRLVPDAAANREAALQAYQSSVGDFPALIRAYSTELDLQLQLLRLQVDMTRSRAQLLYLDPESELHLSELNTLAGNTGEAK